MLLSPGPVSGHPELQLRTVLRQNLFKTTRRMVIGGRSLFVHSLLATVSANHYATLGVGLRSSQSEIKAAYRKLCLEYHPDKQRDPKKIQQASERFKDIQTAYETLSDAAKRRRYDMQRSNPFAFGQQQEQQQQQQQQQHGYAPQQSPFGYAPGDFYFRTQRPIVPPPRARRVFYCSLAELNDGCHRKFILRDGPLSRLRDGMRDHFVGPAREALARTLGLAASLLWRYPSLCVGRRWWLRLPLFALAFAATLAQQLPPSPDGVFEFNVTPGWRAGTKVAFAKRGPRPVAFELREKRHPRLGRRGKHDLVCRASCSRRRALEGTAIVAAVDLGGVRHTLEVRLSEEEEAEGAPSVTRRLPGLGLPKGTHGERGDLWVEVFLKGDPRRGAVSRSSRQAPS